MDEVRTEVECVIDECTICLNGYKLNETKKTTDCNHIFHEECLEKWLTTNNSCPLCRTELKAKQENRINDIDNTDDIDETGGDPILARGVFGILREYNAIDNYLTSREPIATNTTFNYTIRAHTNFAPETINLPIDRNEFNSQQESVNQRLNRESRQRIFASQVNGRAIHANSHFNIPPKNRKHR